MPISQICGYLWIAFAVIWLIWALRTKPVQQHESLSSRLPYSVVMMAAFYAMFSQDLPHVWMRTRILPHQLWFQILGLLLCIAGFALAIWARAYLGGNWSGSVTVKLQHELIRTGPYRLVRHPIYSGLLLAMAGNALVRGQVRGIIAVLLLWVGFTLKSRIEERFMTSTFGSDYADYKRVTGALIPKVF